MGAVKIVLNVADCGCEVVRKTDFLVAMAQPGEDRFDCFGGSGASGWVALLGPWILEM